MLINPTCPISPVCRNFRIRRHNRSCPMHRRNRNSPICRCSRSFRPILFNPRSLPILEKRHSLFPALIALERMQGDRQTWCANKIVCTPYRLRRVCKPACAPDARPCERSQWMTWCANTSGLHTLRDLKQHASSELKLGQAVSLHALAIGSWRMRLPLAANTALPSAGATPAVPGSPIPPGASPLSIRCTSIKGASLIRRTR